MTKQDYDWRHAKKTEPETPEESIERERHCEATDPKRCDFPNCPCGWP